MATLQKSYKLRGSVVIMKLTHLNNDGEVTSETEVTLGPQAAELARAQKDVDKETVARDGVRDAGAETPLPPTGPRGTSRRWFVRNGDVFEQEIRRVLQDGSVHKASSRNLGNQAQALAHCEERLTELIAHRDGVQNAQ